MRQRDSSYESLEAECVLAAKFRVLEVDVVNDLGDRMEPRITQREAGEEHLERAAVALVRKLRVEHVEPELAWPGAVVLANDELEPRVRVDEPADEPAARHPVNVDALPGDPRSAAATVDTRRWLGRRHGGRGGAEPRLDPGD